MIFRSVLNLISTELENYLKANYASPPGDLPAWATDNHVAITSIAQLESDNAGAFSENILLDLVHLERVNTLRNAKLNRAVNLNGISEYRNPPVYLNLYLLLCADFAIHKDAIGWLSAVFEFFQAKNIFNNQLSPILSTYESLTAKQKAEFKLIVEHHTLSIEELNHLWGTLGGRQRPHIFYKARLVEIERDQLQGTGSPITAIHSQEIIQQ